MAQSVVNVKVDLGHGYTYRVAFHPGGRALLVARQSKRTNGKEVLLNLNGMTADRAIAAARPVFEGLKVLPKETLYVPTKRGLRRVSEKGLLGTMRINSDGLSDVNIELILRTLKRRSLPPTFGDRDLELIMNAARIQGFEAGERTEPRGEGG